jgi:hypothetical protein
VKDLAGGLVQVVELLPTKPEALSSNPGATKKEKKSKKVKDLPCAYGLCL